MKPRTLAAASLLLLPAVAAQDAAAQAATSTESAHKHHGIKGETRTLFIKYSDGYEIAGVDGTRAVYRTQDGRLFHVDPKTGDLKFIKTGFGKHVIKTAKSNGRLVGIDAKGNAIHVDPQGRTFTLDARTGDITITK